MIDPFCTTTSEAMVFELYACNNSLGRLDGEKRKAGWVPEEREASKIYLPPCCVSVVGPGCWVHRRGPLEGKRNDDSVAPGTLLQQRHGGRRQS